MKRKKRNYLIVKHCCICCIEVGILMQWFIFWYKKYILDVDEIRKKHALSMQNQIKWRTSLIVMKWSICVQIAISSTKQVMVYRDTKRYMNSLSILKTNCLLLERTTLRYAEHLWNVHCYFETQMMHIGGNRVTTNVKLHMLLSRLGKTQQVSV